MEPADWKDFLLRYPWMPSRQLHQQFEIQKHDIDNFRKKPEVRAVLAPWRISAKQPAARLRAILESGWKYYLTQVEHIDFDNSPTSWVPELIAIKNIGKSGFSFLIESKYLKIACPDAFEDFRDRGYTNVALAAYEFFPGSDFLRRNAVLPYMFQQTHSDTLETTDAQSMIEHVYLNFLSVSGGATSTEQLHYAKLRLFARYNETGFVTADELSRFGVPANFFLKKGTLKSILDALHQKYGEELGYFAEVDPTWSKAVFRNKFPERNTESCEYCGVRPADLHHLVPRKKRPDLTYDSENVVALCVNIHHRITRGIWTSDEKSAYESASKDWLSSSKDKCRRHLFKSAMELLHSETYGKSFVRSGREQ